MTELEFGARLKQYRQEKRLTQQELADILGVSNKSVSRWESGGYPDIATLPPLAKALGVSVDDLLGCRPPLRSLQRSDWQQLLSYGFALGGGVLFYLLDLFMPALVCYLLYLASMAYGVYLQRHYTYHSRWFYGANALMDLIINLRVISFLFTGQLLLASQWVRTQFDTALAADSGERLRLFQQYLLTTLPALLPWLLGALLLTLVTQIIIWRTSDEPIRIPKVRLSWTAFDWRKLPTALYPILLALFFLLYNSDSPMPVWVYKKQFGLFLGLWAVLLVLCIVYLISVKRPWMLVPTCALSAFSLALPAFTSLQRVLSNFSGKFLEYSPKLGVNVYTPFRQPDQGLFPAAAALALLYLACCFLRLERVPSENK